MTLLLGRTSCLKKAKEKEKKKSAVAKKKRKLRTPKSTKVTRRDGKSILIFGNVIALTPLQFLIILLELGKMKMEQNHP